MCVCVHVHTLCMCTPTSYQYVIPDTNHLSLSQEPEKRLLLQAPVDVSQIDTYHFRGLTYERTTSVSALDWLQEFDAINLPHFRRQYIQLVHIPLDVMHECLKLQLGLHIPDTPSHLSDKQVITCTSTQCRVP